MSEDHTKRIAGLKKKAQVNYKKFWLLYESRSCGCGLAMAKEVISGLGGYANNYNKAMAELSAIDPKCPKFNKL